MEGRAMKDPQYREDQEYWLGWRAGSERIRNIGLDGGQGQIGSGILAGMEGRAIEG